MRRHQFILWVLTTVGFLLTPLVLGIYELTVLDFIMLRSIAVLGLVLLTGLTGQVSFGQAAFVALGAYTSGILSTRYGLSPWLSLVIALVVVAIAALLVGIPLLQLKGHYLALGTLALGLITSNGLVELHGLTGGPSGFGNIPAFSVFGLMLTDPPTYTAFLALCLALSLGLALLVADGRLGRLARAVRENELTAECLGVHATGVKLQMFLLAALLSGLSGVLYAHMVRFLNPTPFDFTTSVMLLTMAVVGGMTSPWGALLGAAVLTVLTEALRSSVPGTTAEQQVILFGALLVLLLIFWPQGVVGALQRIAARLRTGLRRPSPPIAADSTAQPPGFASADGGRWLQAFFGQDKATAQHAEAEKATTLLQLSKLTCRFGGLLALDQLDLTVPLGALLAIIGPNGAGKTTVFNAITGIVQPVVGTMMLDGHVLTGLPPYRIARYGIARTFQNVELFPQMTCLENVLVALEADAPQHFWNMVLRFRQTQQQEQEAQAQARQILAFVGLEHAQGTAAGDLPLGQQRALELARAIARRPQVLLLDEPASGLNPAERQQIATLIQHLHAQGLTIMLVEHAMDFVMALANTIVVLNRGQKIAEGTPEAIRQDPAVIAAYLGNPEQLGSLPPLASRSGGAT